MRHGFLLQRETQGVGNLLSSNDFVVSRESGKRSEVPAASALVQGVGTAVFRSK